MNRRFESAIKVAAKFIRLKKNFDNFGFPTLFDMGEAIEPDKTDEFNQVFGLFLNDLAPHFYKEVHTSQHYIKGHIHDFSFTRTPQNTFEFRPVFAQLSMFDDPNTKPIVSMDISFSRSGKWNKELSMTWEKKEYAPHDTEMKHVLHHSSGTVSKMDMEKNRHKSLVTKALLEAIVSKH